VFNKKEIKKKKKLKKNSSGWGGGGGGGGAKLKNAPLLCQTEFHPVLTPSFLFPQRLHCCYIYFHCSYM